MNGRIFRVVLAVLIIGGCYIVFGIYKHKLGDEQSTARFAELKGYLAKPSIPMSPSSLKDPRMAETVDILGIFNNLDPEQRQAILNETVTPVNALSSGSRISIQKFLNDRAVNCKTPAPTLADDATVSVTHSVRQRIYHLPTGNSPRAVPCLDVHVNSG